jgi:hypothetical protein
MAVLSLRITKALLKCSGGMPSGPLRPTSLVRHSSHFTFVPESPDPSFGKWLSASAVQDVSEQLAFQLLIWVSNWKPCSTMTIILLLSGYHKANMFSKTLPMRKVPERRWYLKRFKGIMVIDEIPHNVEVIVTRVPSWQSIWHADRGWVTDIF